MSQARRFDADKLIVASHNKGKLVEIAVGTPLWRCNGRGR